MATQRVIAVAASAGGLTALGTLLSMLPDDFAAPVLIIQHLDPHRPSLMASLLGRRTRLRVKEAEQGDRLAAGTVYVAPPGRHLVIEVGGDTLALTAAAPEHFVRPSADILFRSLAAALGPRAVAVVLTGTGEDGAAGVKAVKEGGGMVIVQDEASSEFFGMPGAAIRTGDVDRILPLGKIAEALVELTTKERA